MADSDKDKHRTIRRINIGVNFASTQNAFSAMPVNAYGHPLSGHKSVQADTVDEIIDHVRVWLEEMEEARRAHLERERDRAIAQLAQIQSALTGEE